MTRAKEIASQVITTARDLYGGGFVPLHRPVFAGREKEYLNQCISQLLFLTEEIF